MTTVWVVQSETTPIRGERRVWILPAPGRPAATQVERLALATLARASGVPLATLVPRIARALRAELVRRGGWAADVGLLGSGVLATDVMRELEAGDGVLWRIEGQ